MRVAPSSTATSKSWLMPIDSSRSISGGTPRAGKFVPKRPEPPEIRPGVLGIRRERAAAASVPSPAPPGTRPPPRTPTSHVSAGAPCLVASPARSTWTSSSGLTPRLRRRRVHPLQQLGAVNRVDPGERPGRSPGLVRLEVSDQMPRDRDIGRGGDLLQCLLDTILAEIEPARRRRPPARPRPDGSSKSPPAGRKKANGQPARARGPAVVVPPKDSWRSRRAATGSPCRLYFLMLDRMPLAVAANWPVGASSRYFSNIGTASASLFWFTKAMPSW